MTRIYILGFMGSGKSTLGKRLAIKLGYDFLDTDRIISERTGLSIVQLFKEYGEDHFRQLELEVLEDTMGLSKVVISTGGGLPCTPYNIAFILKHGISIYLKASPGLLEQRLLANQQQRPLIAGLSIDELRHFIGAKLEEREPYYLQSTHCFNVPVESVESIVKSITLAGFEG